MRPNTRRCEAEYEAKMDRIRAERRLEEKARVAAQNAEVRAKKDAAKAKSDAVSIFYWQLYGQLEC